MDESGLDEIDKMTDIDGDASDDSLSIRERSSVCSNCGDVEISRNGKWNENDSGEKEGIIIIGDEESFDDKFGNVKRKKINKLRRKRELIFTRAVTSETARQNWFRCI